MGSRRLKRDYSQKKYSNSLFNRRDTALKKKQRNIKLKLAGSFLSVILVIMGLAYIFYGNYFRVTDISISGNEEIEVSEIADYANSRLNRSKIIPFYNYWLVGEKFSNDIRDNFYLKEVKFIKKFPNKITLEVKEKEPKFILNSGGQSYLLDDQGTNMGPLSDEKKEKFFDLLKIKDNIGIDIIDADQLISTKEIFVIYKTLNFLDKNGITFNNIEKNAFNEIAVILSGGVKIIFDVEENIDKQLGKLDGIKDDMKTATEYIDVRFGDKVYLK